MPKSKPVTITTNTAPVAPMSRRYRFEPYQDATREFRWRIKAGNGRIVADSGEGYTTKSDLKRAITSLRKAIQTAETSFAKLNFNSHD